MAGLRFTALQSRPLEFLDFTSVTPDEFQHLVLPFETAFHARMAAWRMDGKPRTARRWHCQVVGDDSVTRQQQALSGCDCHRPDA